MRMLGDTLNWVGERHHVCPVDKNNISLGDLEKKGVNHPIYDQKYVIMKMCSVNPFLKKQ